jgi:hypothetical protein
MTSIPKNYKLHNMKTKQTFTGILLTPTIEIGREVIIQFSELYEYRVSKIQRFLRVGDRKYLVDAKGIRFYLEKLV